ncbi:unnamed protein product [Didymodactylos carnosus]|uniref:PID domain-containing protein n=1 Tax=Didymodactylos carnosus TaxID=1234261 RepID=A0A813TW62_9BILA|nr:unnamed protein product [Didymodactylos carnosus]CAF0817208.1 unnamed protein product [Didymodactylos carnosus]CAF3517278.1 unnamed protein product [Didymodactylos carnosus]CAF3603431.1 unnamed protein product [Didymodactylos carnosus]
MLTWYFPFNYLDHPVCIRLIMNEVYPDDESLQTVKYLGKIRTHYAHGIGVAIEPVKIIWRRSKKGTRYNRCALSIHSFGLSNGTYKSIWYDRIEDISYCVAEPSYRKVFAWIARDIRMDELDCHAVVCKTSKKSKLLAELLARAFQDSYRHRQILASSLPPAISTVETSARNSARCSVCDTIRNWHEQRETRHSTKNLDYERVSSRPVSPIARAIVRNYSISNKSLDDNDDEDESIKPVEYFSNREY